MTPKSLLRLPACVSTAEELTDGKWEFIVDNDTVKPKDAKRLLLCSGKVFYDLDADREEHGIGDTAICRVEHLYPLPSESLTALFAKYSNATEIVWVQEEPRNMGAWPFVQDRFIDLIPEGRKLRYIGRPRGASPATGSNRRHQRQQAEIVGAAFGSEKPAKAGAV